MHLQTTIQTLFKNIQVPLPVSGPMLVHSPLDQSVIARVAPTSSEAIPNLVQAAQTRFETWRLTPAPTRGQLLRCFGEWVRAHKTDLATLISIEVGKTTTESLGEVQEVIDICDFAVGLSRQLHGLVIASERPGHRLLESWHPLGPTLVISAFNFPMAVWAWNAALALIGGNTLIWKPSEKTPLTAWALHALMERAIESSGLQNLGLSQCVVGDSNLGKILVEHPQVRCVSATGSTHMGRQVGLSCAQHFKRSILELGGNNAAIVCASADLEVALPAIVFSAAGTAGQRCTTTRRVFIERSIYTEVIGRIQAAFKRLVIGNPMHEGVQVGPLFDERGYAAFQKTLGTCASLGKVFGGQRVQIKDHEGGFYVQPALVEMQSQTGPMLEETFAPILYALPFDSLIEAVALNNAAVHGLSSAIFTTDLRESEYFLGHAGSDCGIANVNTGTSGAEIGGAFGGEKETGGGRESGSDAWKGYMRRATNTINYSHHLSLAQGVEFYTHRN
jgi:aldehyde dehydrogenase (NAD+)